MSHPTLQSTLVEVTDGLSRVDAVSLVGMHPHPQARDAFVVDVRLSDPGAKFELRAVAEDVYHHTGALVVFHEM